jgi:hypothetical protein
LQAALLKILANAPWAVARPRRTMAVFIFEIKLNNEKK